MKVLIVEDSPALGQLLRKCVERLGIEVMGSATSAAEAMRLAVECWPSLAIVSLEIPGQPGSVELAKQLLRVAPLPIIFVSAATDHATLARMWQTKPAIILPKPLEIPYLDKIIQFELGKLIPTKAA